MKRIKSLTLVTIDEADPTRCDIHITWADNTFEIFFDEDWINKKRIMNQYFRQSKQK